MMVFLMGFLVCICKRKRARVASLASTGRLSAQGERVAVAGVLLWWSFCSVGKAFSETGRPILQPAQRLAIMPPRFPVHAFTQEAPLITVTRSVKEM